MRKVLTKLFILFIFLFVLVGCETFEEVEEKIPTDYKAVSDYKDLTKIDLVDVCKDKEVFIITPGFKEISALVTLVAIYDNYTIDTKAKPIDVTQIESAINSGKDVVVIIAPGVSSKGLGEAGINLTSEIDRAKAICELNSVKNDNSDHVTLIQVNNESYDAKTDGKSVNMFDAVFPYIDILVVQKNKVNNIFRTPQTTYKFEALEVTSLETVFDVMFGVK